MSLPAQLNNALQACEAERTDKGATRARTNNCSSSIVRRRLNICNAPSLKDSPWRIAISAVRIETRQLHCPGLNCSVSCAFEKDSRFDTGGLEMDSGFN
jgi:hypothetical protein